MRRETVSMPWSNKNALIGESTAPMVRWYTLRQRPMNAAAP
jgi:hypothetical protein